MRYAVAQILAVALLTACSRDSTVADSAVQVDTITLPIVHAPPDYAVADSVAGGWGSISVLVGTAADTLRDTLVTSMSDADACGQTLIDNSLQRQGRMLGGAITWIPALRTGKDYPIRKRFDITHQNCLLTPRAQGVLKGGTLNLRNMDDALHILRFTDTRTGEVLARITQSDHGQVVPLTGILDQARRITVTCDTHPWTKAWIVVFDTPYFGTTAIDGTALLDSVPVGTHEVFVWHERFGEKRASVNVTAGARAVADILFGGG